jgi:hypothetical protein
MPKALENPDSADMTATVLHVDFQKRKVIGPPAMPDDVVSALAGLIQNETGCSADKADAVMEVVLDALGLSEDDANVPFRVEPKLQSGFVV